MRQTMSKTPSKKTSRKSADKKEAAKNKKSIKAKRKNSRKKSKGNNRFWLKFFLIIFLIVSIICGGYIFYCWITLPDISKAIERTRLPATTILTESGQEIESYGGVYSEIVYAEDLPSYVRDAVISISGLILFLSGGQWLLTYFTDAMSKAEAPLHSKSAKICF